MGGPYSKACVLLFNGHGFHLAYNHEKDSLQTNVQKPVHKENFERHVKLQADPWRIRDGACDTITISIGLKKISDNQERTRALS